MTLALKLFIILQINKANLLIYLIILDTGIVTVDEIDYQIIKYELNITD